MEQENNAGQEPNLDDEMMDVDLDALAAFYKRLPRQSPGSDQESNRALMKVRPFLPEKPLVADMGCGTGTVSRFLLARLYNASVQGVEVLPGLADAYNRTMDDYMLSDRARAICAPLDATGIEEGSLDLIWAEGSVFNVGFEEGLLSWRDLLKTGGCVALTDTVWFDPTERPVDPEWLEMTQPDICTLDEKKEWMKALGYEVLDAFILPAECHIDNYYAEIQKVLPFYFDRYKDNRSAMMLYKSLRYEISFFNRYSHMYGYAFFIGRKV